MASHGRTVLLVLLVAALIAFIATAPMRARMSHETARIDRDTERKTAAISALKENEAEAARLRFAVDAGPSDVKLKLDYAAALSRLGRYPEAACQIRAAQTLGPTNPEPHVALGELSDATGLPDIAVREYRRAIDLDPRHAKALSLLAYRYIAFGWNKDASEILQRAIKEVPGDVRLRVSMGLLHFQNGDSGAAERELHVARRLSPDDPAILGPLIQVYQQASRYQDALATVDEAIQRTPDRAVLHLERAKILLKLRDYDGAVGAANQVLKLEPVSLHALYQRGSAYKMSGDATRAIADLEKVHAKEPRLENTLLHLGNLYLQAGRVDDGKELLATFKRYRAISGHLARLTLGVANKGRDPESHYQLGEYYLKVGSYARAVVELKRALELNPKHPLVRPHLRTALHKMNRHPEAQAI